MKKGRRFQVYVEKSESARGRTLFEVGISRNRGANRIFLPGMTRGELKKFVTTIVNMANEL